MRQYAWGRYGSTMLISAATLIFEITLTRLFSLAEWYHLAFLSIAVALLGNAAGGTILALLGRTRRWRLFPWWGWGFPLSLAGAYVLFNALPFDSYQFAWDPRQLGYLALQYLGLVVPFGFSGLCLAQWLALYPQETPQLYGANLLGSALGSLSLLGLLPLLGGEGTVMAAVSLAALAAILVEVGWTQQRSPLSSLRQGTAWAMAVAGLVLATTRPAWLQLHLSPYKSLSQHLAAGARQVVSRWNTFSRVDVVESERIHSAPGLSLLYQGQLPPQHGVLVDGDNLSPITRRQGEADEAFLAYLPSAVPYRLRTGASVLILRPRGGLEVAAAVAGGARRIVAVESNPLVARVVGERYALWTGNLYHLPQVTWRIEEERSALERLQERFDIVLIALSEGYHPLTSGSYSLTENYLYTVEAASCALRRLTPHGLLVLTRWLQDPPSECLRAAGLVVSALEREGLGDAAQHLLAFRSWSTMTILASPSPFAQADIAAFLQTCAELGYDPVWFPGMGPELANRYNILPRPVYYEALRDLLLTPDRRAFYRAQEYDVTPPTDDRPFFGHYFRWRQVPAILRQWGKTWQPFGGSGFLLVWALLVFSLVAAGLLIGLPLIHRPRELAPIRWLGRMVLYFASLGLAYLLIELPLMQQLILYLGQPTLSLILTLSALLLFSGLGSLNAGRFALRPVLIALLGLAALYPFLLRALLSATLQLALGGRIVLALVCLAPLGFLMGMPFAGGMRRAEEMLPGIIPWLWAINGGASVVSSILATLLALAGGFRLVWSVAGLCYLCALAAFWPLSGKPSARRA